MGNHHNVTEARDTSDQSAMLVQYYSRSETVDCTLAWRPQIEWGANNNEARWFCNFASIKLSISFPTTRFASPLLADSCWLASTAIFEEFNWWLKSRHSVGLLLVKGVVLYIWKIKFCIPSHNCLLQVPCILNIHNLSSIISNTT